MGNYTTSATVTTEDNGYLTVRCHFMQAGTDRTEALGWSLPDTPAGRKLAQRLAMAIDCQRVMVNPTIKADIYGRTYVEATSRVFGRYMNRDLKKIGF